MDIKTINSFYSSTTNNSITFLKSFIYAISGSKNRVFDIESGLFVVGIETLSRLSIFRSMVTVHVIE